jgi:hypothetical protein
MNPVRKLTRLRLLRNLHLREVSAVDRAANQHAQVMLMKCEASDAAVKALSASITSIIDDPDVTDKVSEINKSFAEFSEYMQPKDQTMQTTVDLSKAASIYKCLVDLEKVRHPDWSMSQCHSSVIKTQIGAEALELSLIANRRANDPSNPAFGKDEGGRVTSPTLDRGHGDSSNYADPFRSTRNQASDDELGRLREPHAGKALVQFNQHVDALVAGGMKRSEAQSHAIRNHPDLWMKAKEARAPMQPLSHDGNAPRPRAFM